MPGTVPTVRPTVTDSISVLDRPGPSTSAFSRPPSESKKRRIERYETKTRKDIVSELLVDDVGNSVNTTFSQRKTKERNLGLMDFQVNIKSLKKLF